ncbi:MAG: ATP-dependent RNA helicase HrpA [Planctomycetaceae bacterium]|nr:ATP-dependent RNA helicase HrpA [Planctomycetaceae bacterium]
MKKEILRTTPADRFRLQSRLKRLEEESLKGRDIAARIETLENDVAVAYQKVEERRKSFPKITFDNSLPINERRNEIAEIIRENQVVVICGETGSGKSTQIPKICLDVGRGLYGMIGHTQPRRIAARSVAARIAEELNTPLGWQVGYKVRFADQTSPKTLVKLMTDGILLAESQNDRFFNQYDTIIIDEAHERSLNIDFLLGMMRRLIQQRRDLKLIVTSATIDAARFAEHFTVGEKAVTVVEVSGRTFPIEIRYRPILAEKDADNSQEDVAADEEPDMNRAVLNAVDELTAEETVASGRGDILIFMPTERDILETAKLLRSHAIPGDPLHQTEILPLYARLPVGRQQQIFKTSAHRRIVIATNVAESSLTVPGIRYVIDTGTARLSRYSAKSRTQRLPIEAISQASANQRAGRCGRIGPGICVRLYGEADYNRRDRYTTPEIQRTNLASVILQTKSLKLGAVEKFPFLDPPRSAAISDGYKTLFEIGAIDARQNLTDAGRRLARLPVDPRIARMILAAEENGVLREMLIIAAALEIQDPRERPYELQEKADAAHQQFLDPQSDFLTYLKMWDFYHALKEKLSQNQLRKACVQNFLSYNRMREWTDIHLQLQPLMREAGMTLKKRRENDAAFYDALHRSILVGLLSGIAHREQKFEYATAGGAKFFLWPGSGIARQERLGADNVDDKKETVSDSRFPKPPKPNWIVAAERVETTRKFLRTVGRVESEWIEPLAAHLTNKSYHEPHWSEETGRVMAYEKVTLFGLTIVPRRRVNYGTINPAESREIFLNALTEEEAGAVKADFYRHNRQLQEEAKALQAKLRRHEFLLGAWAVYDFYQSRIPDAVYDRPTLERWYKTLDKESRRSLFMTLADVAKEDADESLTSQFPDSIATLHGTEAKLEYAFAPGESNDGLTAIVPLESLREIEPSRPGWLVPGLLAAKVEAMLRALPKSLRRLLAPIPDAAKTIVSQIHFGDGSLEETVARLASRIAGERIAVSDFDLERLPEELRMNFRILGADGKPIAESRNLETLRKEFGVRQAEAFAAITVKDVPQWGRENITAWDFGDFPETLEIRRGGIIVTAYPALVDQRESVAQRFSNSLDQALNISRLGVLRLFQLANRKELRTQALWIPGFEKLNVFALGLPDFDLKRDLADLLAARAFELDEKPTPRSEAIFNGRLQQGKERIGLAVQDVARVIAPLLENFQQTRFLVEQNAKSQYQTALNDVKQQINRLFAPGFLLDAEWRWLKEYPRYLKAIAQRFDKLKSGGEPQDICATRQLERWQSLYEERLALHDSLGIADAELTTFRWMLEEYRVSLFAQKLGTSIKVSEQRLEKQWEKSQR